MAVYHQMGHQSDNLLDNENLNQYRGAILSPVNYEQVAVLAQILLSRDRQNFVTIFDPQLYVPTSDRGHLRDWPYFPSDVDSADLASNQWWQDLVAAIVDNVAPMQPTAICSPAIIPRVFNDDYYSRLVADGRELSRALIGKDIRPIQSAIVGLADLAVQDRALAVASILSQTDSDTIYLLLYGDTHPRNEFSDTEEIKGAIRLVSLLEEAGIRVTVGYCSSDILLWKAVGASSCSTGKFFNLRRFSRARFEEPPQGGGQLPYWFEESLMAFLRESDLIRVKDVGMLSESSQRNPFSAEILDQLRNEPGKPWLALGWRQFMWWFADIENRISHGNLDADDLLRRAEQNWVRLDRRRVLMEEVRNDGSWLRPWRRALAEYNA
jgi:hypothetical protein